MADTKVPQRAGAERPNDAATKRDHVVTYSAAWPVGLRYGVRRNTKRTPITRQPWGDTVVSRPLCRARAIEIRDALNRGEAFVAPPPVTDRPVPEWWSSAYKVAQDTVRAMRQRGETLMTEEGEVVPHAEDLYAAIAEAIGDYNAPDCIHGELIQELVDERDRLRHWLTKAAQMAEQQAAGGEDVPMVSAWTWLADNARIAIRAAGAPIVTA